MVVELMQFVENIKMVIKKTWKDMTYFLLLEVCKPVMGTPITLKCKMNANFIYIYTSYHIDYLVILFPP